MSKDLWEQESGITVGELIEYLNNYSSDTPICFGPHGHFTFYRVKDRGGVCQIEFNESPGNDYDLSPDHAYLQYFKSLKLGGEDKQQ